MKDWHLIHQDKIRTCKWFCYTNKRPDVRNLQLISLPIFIVQLTIDSNSKAWLFVICFGVCKYDSSLPVHGEHLRPVKLNGDSMNSTKEKPHWKPLIVSPLDLGDIFKIEFLPGDSLPPKDYYCGGAKTYAHGLGPGTAFHQHYVRWEEIIEDRCN